MLTNVKSSLEHHFETVKHKTNLAKFAARTSSDIDLMADLATYFASHPDEVGGKNVTQNEQLFRYRVTETFLAAGIDIAKADSCRYLLERSGTIVASATHLRSFIPKVEALEVDRVKDELGDNFICWIFDGTTRIGELLACVARFCSKDFRLEQRLAVLKTFKHHLNASQMATFLTEAVIRLFQIPVLNSIQWSRDSAAINGAAVGSLQHTFSAAEDGKCFPHTLSHVGEHMELDPLDGFVSLWIQMVYSSAQAKGFWKALIGEPVQGYSTVRWHCRAEIMMQLAVHFPKILPAMHQFEAAGLAPKTLPRLMAKYAENTQHLRLQLAAMLDVGAAIVKETYALEGDGCVLMLAYERLEGLRAFGRRVDEPGILVNTAAAIRDAMPLVVDRTRIVKHWEGFGMCAGQIIAIGRAESTLYNGMERTIYTVRYDVDGTMEDLEEEEIRPLLQVTSDDLAPVDGVRGGFQYLEDRLRGKVLPEAIQPCPRV